MNIIVLFDVALKVCNKSISNIVPMLSILIPFPLRPPLLPLPYSVNVNMIMYAFVLLEMCHLILTQ